MSDIVIVAAARTAVGKFGGSLAKIAAPELGATVIQALLQRSGLSGDQIGEVILGQVLQAGAGQNPARQSVIKSGLPNHVPAMTINKVCGASPPPVAVGFATAPVFPTFSAAAWDSVCCCWTATSGLTSNPVSPLAICTCCPQRSPR